MPDLSLEYLKSRLHYDPETGHFTWVWSRRSDRIGQKAGQPDRKGYTIIEIDGTSHRAARLAFFYMTGAWPEVIVDHINQDKSDDRWKNIRPADYTNNQWNRGLRRDNTSGTPGVYFFKPRGTWTVRMFVRGVMHTGRYHKTKEAAIAERDEMAKRLHGEFLPVTMSG